MPEQHTERTTAGFLTRFSINDITVDPSSNEIKRDGRIIRLPGKCVALLSLLAAHSGQVVTTKTILDQLWGGHTFYVGSLRNAVWRLRRALRDSGGSVEIESIPKMGYRLQGNTHIIDPSSTDREPGADRGNPPSVARKPSRQVTRLSKAIAPLAVLAVLATLTFFWFQPMERSTPGQMLTAIPVTGSSIKELHPEISDDGQSLAYVSAPADGDASSGNRILHIIHLAENTGAPGPVWRGPSGREITALAWSPDGQQLALITAAPSTQSDCTVYVFSLLARASERITDCGHPSLLDWSPDGEKILYARCGKSGCRLFSLAIADKKSRLLHKWSAGRQLLRAKWSPSGSSIAALIRQSPHGWAVSLLDLSRGSTQTIKSVRRKLTSLAWHPHGEALIYTAFSHESPRGELVEIDIRSPEDNRILYYSNVFGALHAVSTTRENNRLAFLQSQYSTHVLSFDLPRSTESLDYPPVLDPLSFIESTWPRYGAKHSPDGQYVAFLGDDGDKRGLYLSNPAGENVRLLHEFDEQELIRLTWAPDAESIAVEARRTIDSPSRQVYVIDIDDPTTAGRLPTRQETILAGWSPDGRYINYVARRLDENRPSAQDNIFQAWRVGIDSARSDPVSIEGLQPLNWQQLLDRNEIYVMIPSANGAGIYEYEPKQGTANLLVDGIGVRDVFNWVVRRDGMYFLLRHADEERLMYYSFDSDKQRLIGILRIPGRLSRSVSGMSISPDGRELLLTNERSRFWEVMLAEFPDY